MKKNVKKFLIGILVSCTALFAVVASGCSAKDDVDKFFDQVMCEHANVERMAGLTETCTEDGYTEYQHCIDCGKDLHKVVLKAKGHKTETIKGYEATCTTMGLSDGAFCIVCEEIVTEQKTLSALGHKKERVDEVKATCTETGTTAGVICANGCGTIYEGLEEIPAMGHNFNETFYCKLCRVDYTTEGLDVDNGVVFSAGNAKNADILYIPAVGEDGISVRTIGSCAFAGSSDYVCNAKEIYVPSTIECVQENAFVASSIERVYFYSKSFSSFDALNPAGVFGENVAEIYFYNLDSVPMLPDGYEEMDSVVNGFKNANVKIYVPANIVDDFKADEMWGVMSDKIFAIPDSKAVPSQRSYRMNNSNSLYDYIVVTDNRDKDGWTNNY